MTMPHTLHPALPDRPAAARAQLPLALRARDGRPLLVGASAFDSTFDSAFDPAGDSAPRTTGAVEPESAERPASDHAQLSLFAPPHAAALVTPHAAAFAISRAIAGAIPGTR